MYHSLFWLKKATWWVTAIDMKPVSKFLKLEIMIKLCHVKLRGKKKNCDCIKSLHTVYTNCFTGTVLQERIKMQHVEQLIHNYLVLLVFSWYSLVNQAADWLITLGCLQDRGCPFNNLLRYSCKNKNSSYFLIINTNSVNMILSTLLYLQDVCSVVDSLHWDCWSVQKASSSFQLHFQCFERSYISNVRMLRWICTKHQRIRGKTWRCKNSLD